MYDFCGAKPGVLMEMEWNFIVRLCVAGLCGTIIGLDREYRVKDAGFRTHFLVALGSALIMIVSQYGFEDFLATHDGLRLDPSRIAAQVVSGIGFIGAGTIIIQKQFVRGLTTAAGIWATAGIGLAVGSGMYGLGIAATLLTLAGLELLSVIFKSIGMRSSLVVFSTSDKEAINRIARVIYEIGFLLVSYDMKRLGHQEKDEYVVSIVLKARKNTEESPLLLLMEQFPEVTVERIE